MDVDRVQLQSVGKLALEAAREAMEAALPLAVRMKKVPPADPVPPLPSSELFAAFGSLAAKATGIVVSLSHDDYATNAGGVQNCIAQEARVFAGKDWAYLHLCPVQALPVLAEPAPPEHTVVWVRLGGKRLGAASVTAVAEALRGSVFANRRRLLVLHHLMGFAPEIVGYFAEAFAPDQTIVWVHDFFTLCPNYALLRNNVAFCGGPPVDSPACRTCAYGGVERKRHLARMKSLFENLQPTVLAPSEIALKFWTQRGFCYRTADTVPLGSLAMESGLSAPESQTSRSHLRVAFVGFPTYAKGWHVFQQLALKHAQDARYSFFHLSSASAADFGRKASAAEYVNITFVLVPLDRAQPNFMADAVAASEIDVVVNWSLCYETFSFTTYESIAGGAFVLASNSAGNIVPAILRAEQGLGLESEQELFKLFASGELFEVAKRRRHGKFIMQPATADYIEAATSGKSAMRDDRPPAGRPRDALYTEAEGMSAEPVIICPYVEDSDVDEVRLVFNLDSPGGARLKFFFWKDEQWVGPERAYEHCWNQFPNHDIIIMHTDISPMPGDIANHWYDDLLNYARSMPHAGMLACNLLYPLKAPDGSWIVQHAGGYFRDGKIGHIGGGVNLIEGTISGDIVKYEDDLKKVRRVDWVNFGAVYIRAEVLSRCGSFDRRYKWAYVMDVDYCFEARRKGYELFQVPVNLLHYERRTTLPMMLRETALAARVEENFRLFYEKWGQEVFLDRIQGEIGG